MTADALPVALRQRVLGAAARERPAGRPVGQPPEIPPVEAFARAADAFSVVLDELDDAQWHSPVLRGLDVQGLVGHLTGVEHDVQRALTGDTGVAEADHVDSTQAAALGEAGRRPLETSGAWRAAVDRTLREAARRTSTDRVSVHGLRLPLGALLVVRAFELWVHGNDIRAAVGSPPIVPEAAVLARMTALAVRFLPYGMTRVGSAGRLDLHLVLTGPGGGTWDVPLGEDAGAGGDVPDLLVVADAVEFCRLAGNRVDPARFDAYLRGATDRAPEVFRAAAALALD